MVVNATVQNSAGVPLCRDLKRRTSRLQLPCKSCRMMRVDELRSGQVLGTLPATLAAAGQRPCDQSGEGSAISVARASRRCLMDFCIWARKLENYIASVYTNLRAWMVEQDAQTSLRDMAANDTDLNMAQTTEINEQLFAELSSFTEGDSFHKVCGSSAGHCYDAWRRLHSRWVPYTNSRSSRGGARPSGLTKKQNKICLSSLLGMRRARTGSVRSKSLHCVRSLRQAWRGSTKKKTKTAKCMVISIEHCPTSATWRGGETRSKRRPQEHETRGHTIFRS